MSFVWNGVSSDTMKFNVTSRQVYNAPAYDLNAIEVPGRSGDLLNPQNRFKTKQVTYTGFLKASDFEGTTWREKLSTGLIQLKGWLCSDAGNYHELTDDYDPGFTRYGYISGETAISDIEDRPFGVTLTVTFNCKPFMYKAGEPMELPEVKTVGPAAIASFSDGAQDAPLKSLVFNIEPVQSGSGDPSPTNIRPISGWTQVKVWVKPTYDTTLTPTATIPLGRTVYGGTLDVLAGEGESQLVSKTYSGAESENWRYSSGRFNILLGDAPDDSTSRMEVLCNIGKYASTGSAVGTIFLYGKFLYYYAPSNITTVADFKAWLASNNLQVVYPLASPITFSVTPHTIKTLLGVNNIWADSGDTTLEYPIPTESPYPFESRPLYEITMAGTGALVVNGKEWTITNYTGTLYCDTEAMEWYDASQLRNNIVSGDGWPAFEAGENSVSYTGDITKVMVTPRWRTL